MAQRLVPQRKKNELLVLKVSNWGGINVNDYVCRNLF